MQNATPRPWQYDLYDTHASFYSENDGKKEYAFRVEPGIEMEQEEFSQTLDFIVRAVNSHEALIEALERSQKHLKAFLDSLDTNTAAFVVTSEVIKQNANALKLAKGE